MAQKIDLVRLAAVITFLFLMATSFRMGWTRPETDFPNYYTAATLVSQHQPLRNYYDWTWFARQMNYSGNGTQLGAYTPQTPLTMLPMLPLVRLSPQNAKRVWLVFSVIFLLATVWLLSRITKFRFEAIWLLAFCGYFSLRTNFVYGQYYVFLLFLLTLAFYCIHSKRYPLAGSITAMAFALKLYGGPFFLHFAAKRQWKALLGMAAVTVLLVAFALVLFGSQDVHYYASQILPRSLEGSSIDPYAPGSPTLSAVLWRSFMADPELNPHPFYKAPWLFFFLRTLVSMVILGFLVGGTSMKGSSDSHDYAWFVIGLILLSTSTASYTFILFLLPVVLLLQEAGTRLSAYLAASYVLLTLPLHPIWLFPKVWLLLALFVVVGYPNFRKMRRGLAWAVLVPATLIAFLDAHRNMRTYAAEPGQHFERVAVQEGAIFSSFPAVSRSGIFYQSMAPDRYVLRWLHGGQNTKLAFDGHALQPRLAPDGERIYFELVANRSSRMMQFDPSTGNTTPLATPVPSALVDSAISPDGKWLAFTSASDGSDQIWLRNLSSLRENRLTGGNCNSSAPAWDLDSQSIVFASDCGRAFGLPALYRAWVAQQ